MAHNNNLFASHRQFPRERTSSVVLFESLNKGFGKMQEVQISVLPTSDDAVPTDPSSDPPSPPITRPKPAPHVPRILALSEGWQPREDEAPLKNMERRDSFAFYSLLSEGYEKSTPREASSSPNVNALLDAPTALPHYDEESRDRTRTRLPTVLGLSPRGRFQTTTVSSEGTRGEKFLGITRPRQDTMPGSPPSGKKLTIGWKNVKIKLKSKKADKSASLGDQKLKEIELHHHADGSLTEERIEVLEDNFVSEREKDQEKEKEEKEKEKEKEPARRYTGEDDFLEFLRSNPEMPQQTTTNIKALQKRLGTDNNYSRGTPKSLRRLAGWMWKQGLTSMSRWKKRWFVLNDNRLYYSARPESDSINYLLFNGNSKVTRCASKHKKFEHCLQIELDYTERVYVLATETEGELDGWLALLQDLVKSLEKRFSDQKEFIIKHIFTPHRMYRTPSGSKLFNTNMTTPNSTREVLDVLINTVNLGSPAWKEVYLSIALGAQEFTTWRTKKSDDLTHLWQGVGCTFTEEGCRGNVATGSWWDSESEPVYLNVGLYRRSNIPGGKDTCVADDKIDVTKVPKDHPLECTLVLKLKTKRKASEPTELTFGATISISITLQKSCGLTETALLHSKGLPSTAIPLRLDTGDILLFSNTNLLSYSTKIFTASQWDHVAMVVRWWNNELKLFEATSDEGVEMYNLDDRLEFLQSVCKVAVRQLNAPRTPEMLDALYIFIDEVSGRPFQRNRLSMVKAAGGLNSSADLSSLFCSELTAEAYKRMGLMDPKCVSSNFLPKSWADKSNKWLMLDNGISLGRKYIFKRTEMPPELTSPHSK